MIFLNYRKKDRSFSTGKKLRSIDDDNNMEPPKEKFNNALEDMKYLNYARKKDSFDNQKSIFYFIYSFDSIGYFLKNY